MIKRYLDASTCHVTHNDMELLKRRQVTDDYRYEHETAPHDNPIYAYNHPWGAFITGPDLSDLEQAHDVDEACRNFGYSESFIRLLIYARLNDCMVIRLDADGDEIPGLDVHQW